MILDPITVRSRFNSNAVDFLRAEAGLGITLANIALGSDDAGKVTRNRSRARAAYDAVIRYRDKVDLSREEGHEVAVQLRRLRTSLRAW